MMKSTTGLDIQWRSTLLATDVLAITELVSCAGVFTSAEIQCAGEIIAEALQRGAAAGYHFLFAEHNRQVIGYTCYGIIPLTDHSYDIYWIAVHPDYQQHGLGKQLLQRTEHAITALGGKQAYLETSTRDIYLPAQKFYNKNGYATVVILEDYYRNGDGKIIYRKLF